MTVCGRHFNPAPPLNPLKIHVANVQPFTPRCKRGGVGTRINPRQREKLSPNVNIYSNTSPSGLRNSSPLEGTFADSWWWMICVPFIIMQSHSHEYQANVLPLQGVRGVVDEVSPCTRQTVCGRHLNPIPPLNPLKVHVTNVQTFSNEVYIPCNRISTKKTLFNISNLSTKPNPLSQTLLPYWIILCHQDTESQSFTKKINPLPLPGLLYREGVYSGLFLTNIYHHMRTLQTFNHLPLVRKQGAVGLQIRTSGMMNDLCPAYHYAIPLTWVSG